MYTDGCMYWEEDENVDWYTSMWSVIENSRPWIVCQNPKAYA